MITSEEVRTLILRPRYAYANKNARDYMLKYITQQEKVNELLELKNRKIEYLKARLKYNHGDRINFLMYFDINLNIEALEDIEIEIKALEEELK